MKYRLLPSSSIIVSDENAYVKRGNQRKQKILLTSKNMALWIVAPKSALCLPNTAKILCLKKNNVTVSINRQQKNWRGFSLSSELL